VEVTEVEVEVGEVCEEGSKRHQIQTSGSQTGPPYHTLCRIKGRENISEKGKFSVKVLVECHVILARTKIEPIVT
jgi:hypothetical protein